MLYDLLGFRAKICNLKCCCTDCLEKYASCHKCYYNVFLDFRVEKTARPFYGFLPRNLCKGTATCCTASLKKRASKTVSLLLDFRANLLYNPLGN